ncbi:amino acid permease [Mycoplasma iguanae]|uniref:Amino acid permease n=1 Tax=Mycoplasma iguanae TaxID=292461 RepID=A0ABY5RCF3_9MOLU|nr:amino acid permease [Mycoplasma iguanae]UVD81895.1 amino acid permease [Mycoplasma iguanae]
MTQKSAKKIGFWLALTMLLGSVIGIGIFFKNGSIQRQVDSEGWTWLAAWIVGGVMAAAAAISFSEMGFFKNTKLTGLANWAHKVGGKGYGYFISFGWSFFYFGILCVILAFFGAEVLIFFLANAFQFDISAFKIWHLVIITIFTAAFFVTVNFVSTTVSGWIQAVTTILKFVPLVLAIFIGIIAFQTHSIGGENAFALTEKSFDFKKMIMALPAVLFAYDAFLTVGSLGKKVKKPNKNIPLIVIFGMLAVIVLYTLIAISSILHNQGQIHNLLADSLPEKAKKPIIIFTFFFLLISTYGVINGFSAGFVAEMEQQRRIKLLLGISALSKKRSRNVTTAILTAGTMIVWALATFIPTIILNTDKFIDGFSNLPTVFFFALHGVTIILYLIKKVKNPEWIEEQRAQNKKGLNKFLIWTASIIGSLGFIAAFIINIALLVLALSEDTYTSSWGVFFDNGVVVSAAQELAIWLSFLAILIIAPFINYWLVKIFEKRDLIKDFDEIAGPNLDDDSEIIQTSDQNQVK